MASFIQLSRSYRCHVAMKGERDEKGKVCFEEGGRTGKNL